MDKIRIEGGRRLQGSVPISGSKNAALPILISSILTEEACDYSRVPDLQDIRTTFKLLKSLGTEASPLDRGSVQLRTSSIRSCDAPYDLVRTMRASVIVLGPLLARYGRAKVSLPGGCAIGARPINLHLTGLEKLGARIKLESGYVLAECDRLRGAKVAFDFPSVGATENLMLAAVLAKGTTVLENCAKEPEIVDLAKALRSMGAKIQGEGEARIEIEGVDRLSGAKHAIMGDRIEAGTFLAAGFITGGDVTVEGLSAEHLESVLVKFETAGAEITREPERLRLRASGRPKATDIQTLPFPGFPTDMQAQFMAVMTVAEGSSTMTETIFENRFMHVPELLRLGADITIRGNTAVVKGKETLHGAPLMATDLRASASLILAALAARGESWLNRVYHLDRGYESMELKLARLGAVIERVKS